MGKEYLNEKEAAEFACVSYNHFRKEAAKLGILPFSFMGKRVYRSADLKQAMEREAKKQYGNIKQTG